MNWEEQDEDWKVEGWIENNNNMKTEKLIFELKRAISRLKSWLMNWEEQY
jgi:hypothetical protein